MKKKMTFLNIKDYTLPKHSVLIIDHYKYLKLDYFNAAPKQLLKYTGIYFLLVKLKRVILKLIQRLCLIKLVIK